MIPGPKMNPVTNFHASGNEPPHFQSSNCGIPCKAKEDELKKKSLENVVIQGLENDAISTGMFIDLHHLKFRAIADTVSLIDEAIKTASSYVSMSAKIVFIFSV